MGKQDGRDRQVTTGPVDDSTATVLHVDMDAFYASVELLDHPELRGKPVIVGHNSARSIVTAATYEARAFGVNSALPMSIALRRCPHAIVLEPHFERYTHYSKIVMSIFDDITPRVERLGIDEAFLDVAGARAVFGTPVQVAELIRARVRAETGLVCSVGAAATKFVAKLASGLSKPDGLLVVPRDDTVVFLHPLPVAKLWGVGGKTEDVLRSRGYNTIGDLARAPVDVLARILGEAGAQRLHDLAWGIDPRVVHEGADEKSIGHEMTFETDVTDTDSASSATLCALLAARERASAGAGNRDGVGSGLVAYTSTEAHSSVIKAARIAGIGDAQLRVLPTRHDGTLAPDALAAAIASDHGRGQLPFFCVATIGTTARNAVDPVAKLGTICQQHGVWLHVDAAMAGSAALCPELRHHFDGLEHADSYCFNPHKWLFTNFDCDAFYVADRAALVRALGILPEYLRNSASDAGAVIDYRDWQIPLGRRFRALKLWFVLRWYGAAGLRDHLRRHMAWARSFAGWVAADPDFELVGEVPFSLVCFRHRAGDAFNERLLSALNASGALYLSHALIEGRYTLRLSVGGTHTEARHVEAAWRRICAVCTELGAG